MAASDNARHDLNMPAGWNVVDDTVVIARKYCVTEESEERNVKRNFIKAVTVFHELIIHETATYY